MATQHSGDRGEEARAEVISSGIAEKKGHQGIAAAELCGQAGQGCHQAALATARAGTAPGTSSSL